MARGMACMHRLGAHRCPHKPVASALAVPHAGIITIEDVIEELMGIEIVDETDKFMDNEQSIPVNLKVGAAAMRSSVTFRLLPPGAHAAPAQPADRLAADRACFIQCMPCAQLAHRLAPQKPCPGSPVNGSESLVPSAVMLTGWPLHLVLNLVFYFFTCRA